LKYAAELVTEKAVATGDLSYVGLENIEPWTGRLLQNGPGNTEGQSTHFESGDVLFGKLRPYLAKVLLAEFEGACTGEALVLRPRQVRGEFLRFLLLTPGFISAVDASTYGAKMPRANWSFIGNLPIPIPPQLDQQKLAHYLRGETAKLSAALERERQLCNLLEEKRFAIIHQFATKGQNAHVHFKNSGVEWIGEIPSHWTVSKLKYVARLETGHTPSRQHPEYWENCTVPWFSLADVWQLRDSRREYLEDTAEKVSELGLANSAARLLPSGTVIVSRTASVGFSGIMPVPMATTQDFVNWICGPKLLPEYLLYVFRSMRNEFRRLTMGSTHQTIYMPDVRRFVTPVPPIEEQRLVVARIREEVHRIDRLVASLGTQIERFLEYRHSLITAVVTGAFDSERVEHKTSIRESNSFFKRAVLAAEILQQLHQQPELGQVKLQKLIHLCEHHAQLTEIQGTYLRDAAGPHDNRMMRSIEARLADAKWFQAVKRRDGMGTEYIPLPEAGRHARYFESYWGTKKVRIQGVIDLLRPMKTQQAEIVATLYAAWNDLIVGGGMVTDEAILREVLTRWHEKKTKIPRERWLSALEWMRKKDLVPTGFGNLTKLRTA
jgi:type I restriction enzyme S subunit